MNNKKSYSVLSLALICMMLFTSFYIPPIEASAESYNDISSDEIPSDVKRANDDGLRLNEDLYIKQGILVYGDYTDVMRIRENDFKAVAGGYYHTDVAGEYRFHGFTYSGSLYTNEDFPEDMAMTMGMDQYHYIKNWTDYDTAYGEHEKNKIAKGERLEKPLSEINNVRNVFYQILKKANFSDSGNVPNNSTGDASDEPWYYANIQTYPSEFTKAEVMMKHKRTDLPSSSKWHDSEWYLDLELRPGVIDLSKTKPRAYADIQGRFDLSQISEGSDYEIALTLDGRIDDMSGFLKLKKTVDFLINMIYNNNDMNKWGRMSISLKNVYICT